MRAMASGLRGVFLAAILYAFAGAASAQETVIVGGGDPAAEVNEANIFGVQPGSLYRAGRLGQGIGSDGLPLYDPALGPLRSRLIGLVPDGGRVPAVLSSSAPIVLRRPSAIKTTTPTPLDREVSPVVSVQPLPDPMPAPALAPERSSVVTVPPAPEAPPPVVDVARSEVEVPEIPPTVTVEEAPETVPALPPVPDTALEPAGEPASAPVPVAAPERAAAPETAVAAVAPPPGSGVALLIPFVPGGAELSPEAEGPLRELAASLTVNEALRLQLKAYASAEHSVASAARRLSLSRALAVRSFLIDTGVNSTRIDVRALGAKYESGPPDRVDVITVR
ncbi:MAG TPA: OmpA family protein [Alphaproteobacteria bacterium]|nr:OmpA family protein [Alphaproteobacteria bacterium]